MQVNGQGSKGRFGLTRSLIEGMTLSALKDELLDPGDTGLLCLVRVFLRPDHTAYLIKTFWLFGIMHVRGA